MNDCGMKRVGGGVRVLKINKMFCFQKQKKKLKKIFITINNKIINKIQQNK